jgi:hypothetical protein
MILSTIIPSSSERNHNSPVIQCTIDGIDLSRYSVRAMETNALV